MNNFEQILSNLNIIDKKLNECLNFLLYIANNAKGEQKNLLNNEISKLEEDIHTLQKLTEDFTFFSNMSYKNVNNNYKNFKLNINKNKNVYKKSIYSDLHKFYNSINNHIELLILILNANKSHDLKEITNHLDDILQLTAISLNDFEKTKQPEKANIVTKNNEEYKKDTTLPKINKNIKAKQDEKSNQKFRIILAIIFIISLFFIIKKIRKKSK